MDERKLVRGSGFLPVLRYFPFGLSVYHAKGACVWFKSAAGCRWGGFKCRSSCHNADARRGKSKTDPDRQQKLFRYGRKRRTDYFLWGAASLWGGSSFWKRGEKTGSVECGDPEFIHAYDRMFWSKRGEKRACQPKNRIPPFWNERRYHDIKWKAHCI